jgi:hypothetical protein
VGVVAQDDLRAREIEVDGARREAPLRQSLGQAAQQAQRLAVGGSPRHDAGRLRVRQARPAANDGGIEGAVPHGAFRVELELNHQREPLLARPQRAEIPREPLGKHGNRAVREVDAVAAAQRFDIDGRALGDEVRDVGDGHPEARSSARCFGHAHGVVVVPRRLRIDGDEGPIAQVDAARDLGRIEPVGDRVRRRPHRLGERQGQAVPPCHRAEVRFGVPRRAQHLHHPPANEDDDVAVAGAAAVAARHREVPRTVVTIGCHCAGAASGVEDADPGLARPPEYVENLAAATRRIGGLQQDAVAGPRPRGVGHAPGDAALLHDRAAGPVVPVAPLHETVPARQAVAGPDRFDPALARERFQQPPQSPLGPDLPPGRPEPSEDRRARSQRPARSAERSQHTLGRDSGALRSRPGLPAPLPTPLPASPVASHCLDPRFFDSRPL